MRMIRSGVRSEGSILALMFLSLTIVACGGTGEPVPLPEMPALGKTVPISDEPRRQFDFWLGEWDVRNMHLRDGSWKDSGEARALIRPIVDGGAVLEQWNGSVGGDPLIGFSLRAYDPQLELWLVYLNWHAGQPGGFSLMHGRRGGERMELFPPDDDTQLRYSFSLAHENSCQWDSAQSQDGEVWTPDWIMQFTRREPPRPVDASNATVRRPPDSAAAFPKTRELDFLIGAWDGVARALLDDGSWEQGTAVARVSSMLEGFGLLQFLDTGWGDKSFAALGYDTEETAWVALRTDNRSDGVLWMEGLPEGRSVTFTPRGDASLRETWSCPAEDACDWQREVSGDGGATWQAVLGIRFSRVMDAG